ncbi:hypothetical protein DNTS_003265, partial [Danionella cerebrum]
DRYSDEDDDDDVQLPSLARAAHATDSASWRKRNAGVTEKEKVVASNGTGRRSAVRLFAVGCELSKRTSRGLSTDLFCFPTRNTHRMGQQVGRVGEGTSAGIQTQPQGQQQQQLGRTNRVSGSGRRPRDGGGGINLTGTPPGRTAVAAANIMPDPGINVFTLHSEVAEELCKTASGCQSGVTQTFGHDMPLLPSKCRGPKKQSENKENMEEAGPHGPAGLASSLFVGEGRSSSSPALPRKQRDKSPSSLLEESQETTFTRDRKAGFFSSFMKKKSMSSSSTSSSSQLQQNLPMPPKRSSSFREMETQPHKKYEPTAGFAGPPPPLPQTDGLNFSPSHGEGNHVQSRCCGATFGQKPSPTNAGATSSQVGSSSSWGSLAGFFTPRLIKKTLGLRTAKTSGVDDGSGTKPFPRSNSTSSMSAGLPDLERMALTLPRNRSKPPLERTASTTSQPENGAVRPSDAVLRKLDEGTAQIRDRPKAKLLPRGVAGGVRAPGVGGEAESDSNTRTKDGQDDRQGWSSPSKTSTQGSVNLHNHKVPVLISPSLKHSSGDPQLVGVDSQGNRFKLLADSGDRDRPRLVKPKCAPPPPPMLRSLHHAYSVDAADEAIIGNMEINGDSIKRSGREARGPRPAIPPPQVPPAPIWPSDMNWIEVFLLEI